jgi:hypothetical protein
MDKCLWVGAGYPVLVTAIAVLWRAYTKSQDARLRNAQEFKSTVEELKKIYQRANP